MEDTLISFETAKLAKEKGFDICVDTYLTEKNKDINRKLKMRAPLYNFNQLNNVFSRPTQSLLQKWLREIHNCFIDILPHKDGDSKNKQWKSKKDVFWTVEVDYYGKNFEIELTDESDFIQHFNNSYEEALEIGLQEALKLIK